VPLIAGLASNETRPLVVVVQLTLALDTALNAAETPSAFADSVDVDVIAAEASYVTGSASVRTCPTAIVPLMTGRVSNDTNPLVVDDQLTLARLVEANSALRSA